MRMRNCVIPTMLVGGALCLAPGAYAQANAAYKVQLVLHETQDGKPAATRTYTVMVRPGQATNVAVGNRVPVKTDSEKYSYQDTGLRISAVPSSAQADGTLAMEINVDITSVAPAASRASVYLPTLRTASSRVAAVLPLGKATTVSSIEDLNSNSSYQLEITAVKTPSPTETGQLAPQTTPATGAVAADHPRQ